MSSSYTEETRAHILIYLNDDSEKADFDACWDEADSTDFYSKPGLGEAGVRGWLTVANLRKNAK